jgi:hypothetical protein
MVPRVRFEVPDGRGILVKVFEPCWDHAVKGHPEMREEDEAVKLTISDPDLVIRPANRPKGRGVDRRVNCYLGAHSRYKDPYVVVPIDYQGKESWMLTAYLSPRPPKGDLIFVRVPFRWS